MGDERYKLSKDLSLFVFRLACTLIKLQREEFVHTEEAAINKCQIFRRIRQSTRKSNLIEVPFTKGLSTRISAQYIFSTHLEFLFSAQKHTPYQSNSLRSNASPRN